MIITYKIVYRRSQRG